MKRTIAIAFIFLMLIFGCRMFPIFPNNYTRIFNQSGVNLKFKNKSKITSVYYDEYIIKNNDYIEIEFPPGPSKPILYSETDTISIYFEDGKKFDFSINDEIGLDFVKNGKSERPKKGKYRNNIINSYYIKPIQYELAK